MNRKKHIAVVGLAFGAEFVPIYADHPDVRMVTVCDLDPELTRAAANRFAVDRVRSSLDDVLADSDVDAVHIVTGLNSHADQVIAAFEAGKHVACTVPMALSFADIDRILEAQERSALSYMMMETAVYTREYFFAQQLLQEGHFGQISYGRGTHFQDMTDWPSYWDGLPPMYYATHAVSPMLSLADTAATAVRAMGGGLGMAPDMGRYGNSFSVESALIEAEREGLVFEATRSLFNLARTYTEAFSLYGDRGGFEWPQLEDREAPVVFKMGETAEGRGRPISSDRIAAPDRPDLLPPELRKYTREFVYEGAGDTHLSFIQGDGHGGSHPHLVHEFVSSLVSERAPAIDQRRAANWTAVGIAAHQSAQQGGERISLPSFARAAVQR